MQPQLQLAELEDGGYVVIGDTYMFVGDLFDMGFVYVNNKWKSTDKTKVDQFDALLEKCKTTKLDDCYSLYFKRHKNVGYYVSGATFDFRDTFKEYGGIWKAKQKRWFFRERYIEDAMSDLKEKLFVKRQSYERNLAEQLTARVEYEEMLASNREEITAAVEQLFPEHHRWWPLTKENPRCIRCGLHIVWNFYIENGKDVEKTLQNGNGSVCPKCKVDWTK